MQLSADQLEQFDHEGFILIEDALEDSDLDPVIQEYEEHIERRAQQLLEANKISQLYADEPFERRLACICRENTEIYAEMDIMHFRGRASFEFLHNKNLLDMVEGLVGPEITCSPIQHTRAKLPTYLTSGRGGDAHVAAWHQDAGVTWEEADPFFILTVWLPLVEATPENGCLQIIPRRHGTGLMQHISRAGVGTMITEEEMPESEPLILPMHKGSVLLMHKEIPHRSTPNNTEGVRWSMDLRYQETGTPTGRPFHPDFVARSRSNPDAELRDYDKWCRQWIESLENYAGASAHRWQRV